MDMIYIYIIYIYIIYMYIYVLYIYIFIYIYIYIYIYMEIYVCVFYLKECVFAFVRFSPQDFHFIPGVFCYLPCEKFTARSHPGNFFEIWNFPQWVKQSPPGYWDRVSQLFLHVILLSANYFCVKIIVGFWFADTKGLCWAIIICCFEDFS